MSVLNQPSTSSSIAATNTELSLKFEGVSDGKRHRIRHVTSEADSTMWRVEEVQENSGWTVIDIEPIKGLQVTFPESHPDSHNGEGA